MTIKWFMSPYNWVIYPLTQTQVANEQKKSQVDVTRKFSNSMIFKFFEFMEYFDDVK